jgi:ubiquitin-like modifier-activating enzyme ATG7
MKDQTLDQQCTVTRPGVAAIASALLVELLTSILQHPAKQHAPAPSPVPSAASTQPGQTTYELDPPDHALGIVPHQIRGFLSAFQNIVIRGQSYPYCSACSKPIVDSYRSDGWEFVKKALESRDYVAELSGLAEVQRRAEAAAAELDLSDEEDMDGEEEGSEGVMVEAGWADEKPKV